jgi:hypothetical protein
MELKFDDAEERAIFARSVGLPADASDQDLVKRVSEGNDGYDPKWLTAAERTGLKLAIERRKRTAGL